MPLCPCRTQKPSPSKNYLLLNLHFTNGFLLSSLYNFPLKMQGVNRKIFQTLFRDPDNRLFAERCGIIKSTLSPLRRVQAMCFSCSGWKNT